MSAPVASVPDRFESLPGVNTEVFRKVWGGKRLLYQKQKHADMADECSARLITAAVIQQRSLFIVLPDEKPHRPAFLLSTALIALWWHGRNGQQRSHPPVVMYFGSNVGIREQLRDTSIGGWKQDLASVFEQTKAGRKLPTTVVTPTGPQSSSLPRVITVYSPIDPCGLVQTHKPDLIAIDIADSTHADWFDLLIEHASQSRLPVIAWGTNPLSTSVEQFHKGNDIFIWPPSEFFDPKSYPANPKIHRVQGLALAGKIVDEIEAPFRRVYGLLLRGSKAARNPLEHRAVAAHWNYLRSLESMSVPCELYEAEAPNFWGLKPLKKIRESCQKFRDAVQSELASELESTANLLDQICEIIADEPPLWTALTDFCVDPTATAKRAITFTGRSRKQMFLFALLARYNITEDDLRQDGTEVWSLDQFPRLDSIASSNFEAMLANLPSPLLMPKLLPFLTAESSKVMVFPHQLTALTKRISTAHQKLFSSSKDISDVFQSLGATAVQSTLQDTPTASTSIPFGFSVLIHMNSAATVTVESTKTGKSTSDSRPRRTLLKENAAVEELTRLFEPEEIENSLDTQADVAVSEPEIRESSDEADSDLVPNALVVSFRERYQVSFPTDYLVQLITSVNSRQELRERFVSALRPGDRIVYIQGQRRQSLYDLIISRVHRHPAFEVHLALIRRWQDDLRLAYLAKKPRITVDAVLSQLQTLGSDITSPLTVRNWIQGFTLCPDDPEDLHRIATVMDLGFVSSQYRHIHKAATRVRGIHIGLALRLNNWLGRAGVESESDAEVFDRDLGLTFGDFRHSLILLTVDSLQQISGPFLRSSLGKLEKT
jgi:hypothetical protein